ncbi:guanyl-nucleotide exchange factor [Schizosaccharomyces japonicus yFS275]|uniref:Guanyl-nucleotide exchange factor n=1 Tax=Schizosaccharomyces japonicus (strain yFS275 / FY16936) TaxID=402676 RepID=B6JWT3_SCHJY|nr:guanyl-nucleotide exchange factor [Schizosaccharomyces japonicus yFS275]EEB05834.2 guanyl-nucleotide exchange factor [Schizosaccharomyces japonicus yFS275]
MVSALMYVFFTATKDTVYQHVINGIHQCVTIASQVSLFDTIDFIVGRLSHIVLLSIGSFPRRTFSTTVNYNEASIKVNDATVAIGRDFRAQLAVILLFWIFNKFASSMRYGMQDLFSVLSCLVQENVIEGDCLPTFPFTKTCYFPIPDTTSKKNKSGKESGILSTFSSFLAGYSSENEPTPTETEVEYSLCAADCLKSSKLRECLLNFPTHINNAAAEWLFNTFITITENSERVVPLFISNSLILIETDVDTLRYQFCDEVLISLPIEILTSICLQCPQDYQPYAVKLLMFISQEITRIPAATCHLFSCASALISFKCVSIAEGSMVCRIMDSMLAKLASTNLLAVKPIRHSLLQICENTTVLQKTESFTQLCIQLADQLGTSEEIVPLFEQVCITALPRELYEQFLSSITNSVRKMSKAITATILEHKRSNARNKTLDKEVIDQHAKSVSDLLQLFASTSTMLNTITKINEEDEAEAENLARWKILYKNLRRLCTSQGKTVRATSLTVLQQIIMKQLDAEHDVGVTLLLFDEILVPILQDMMKYSPPRHEGRMMGQAQALMFNILCKTLLIDMTLLSSDSNALPSLWVRVMELSCSLYQLNKSEPLTEVTESLKNVHLILTSAGYIKQSETGELQTTDTALKEQWNSTWKRLLTCFPELTEELKPAKTDIPDPEKTDPSNDS